MSSLRLVFATLNDNKAAEIQKLMPSMVQIVTLKDIGCLVDIPEISKTLEGNALIKARYIWEKYKLNCFADDTGLEIESLNGEPGVFSARYAGAQKNANDNMDLVLQKLSAHQNRKAQFKTVIALIVDGKEYLFDGIVEGEITKEKSGEKGFGYDPIFKPAESKKTFADMTMEEKNKISHRGRAIQKLVKFLSEMK